jgi:hypothetical protein
MRQLVVGVLAGALLIALGVLAAIGVIALLGEEEVKGLSIGWILFLSAFSLISVAVGLINMAYVILKLRGGPDRHSIWERWGERIN